MLLRACKRSLGFKSAAKIDRFESLVPHDAALRWLLTQKIGLGLELPAKMGQMKLFMVGC